jgi:integrase
MRVTLGRYPDLSLATARETADAHRQAVAKGADPARDKRAAREEAEERSFGRLAERYLREHARRFKRSADGDERNLNRHVLPKWRHRPFAEVKRRDVADLLESIVAAGTPVAAARVLSLVRKLFNFAISRGLLENNPATVIGKVAEERARERVLSDHELRLFWTATGGAGPFSRPVAFALRLALLTGCRAGEIAGLRRDEVFDLDDLAKARVVLPPARTKASRRHVLPLSPASIEVVKAALATCASTSFVFGTRDPTEDAPISGTALTLGMRRLAAALAPHQKKPHPLAEHPSAATWRADPPGAHDLRRTASTRLIEAGTSLDIVRRVLNHSAASGDILARHYNQADVSGPMRRALSIWAEELLRIVDGREAESVVVPIRGRG